MATIAIIDMRVSLMCIIFNTPFRSSEYQLPSIRGQIVALLIRQTDYTR
jgi:hypothetical protein